MNSEKNLSASLEDYIETIYHLVQQQQVARVKDIAMKLKVQNASVTGALQMLKKKELIHYAPYSYISLTEKGTEIAKNVIKKHSILRHFFVDVLIVDKKTAEENACRIEHFISNEILDKLADLTNFIKHCPKIGNVAEKLDSKSVTNCVECNSLNKIKT